ncbi:DNA translocase FtsK [Drosophila tropicalis]|uniref:DNA translocase FtsK n=1 Tax=Drosophila tropicalis TaxID=46794 RepID=UPI0035AB93AE
MELLPLKSLILHLLLVAAFLLPSAQLQLIYPRHVYYEAPRLRRLEYATNHQPSAGYMAAATYGPIAPSPGNYQLINYRPNYQPLALDYQQSQQQLPSIVPPAPPAFPIYPQPSVQYQQRAIAPHAELAKYRYEGNYIPIQRIPILTQQQQQQHQQQHIQAAQQPQRRVEEHLYNVPPALFTSDVLHVVPPRQVAAVPPPPLPSSTAVERPRRYAADQDLKDAQTAETKTKETKYYHDIFMRFNGPTSRSHGHVLNHPKAQERRFESQRGTNRYKGEVIWTDRQGSHGEHRWDLAQGKL